MSCPVCKPHANQRRAIHCPVGWMLFREYEAAAQAYATHAMTASGTVFAASRLADAKDEAGARYRAHTEDGWMPARDGEPEPTGDAA